MLWAAVRLLPAAPPAPWLDVPTGEGPIGPGWPARYAASRGATLTRAPDGGLVPDLSAVPGSADVHPLVRAFYEHTARFSLAVEPRWLFGFTLPARVWSAWYARRWGQLELPVSAGVQLSNEIYVCGAPDPCQWWVRRYPDDRALYVSRYEVLEVAGQPDPCVRISFPVPGGALLVLFRVVVRDGAIVLTEDGGRIGGPGLYVVRRGGRARYVRAFREEIRVFSTDDGCRAVHRMWLAGVLFLTLSYAIPLSEVSSAPRGTA